MSQQENIILSKWLEIDCNHIAQILNLIENNKDELITETLIIQTIRYLDSKTSQKDPYNLNEIITIIALMWEYVDKTKYNIRKIAVKFLSRIGYSTSAIISDKEFDKNHCEFTSLESPLEELQATLNQIKYEITIKEKKFLLTKFQMEIWQSMEKERIIGISAPTSAGKSFIILLKLLEKLTIINFDIIYIIPTLSLQTQVTEDFNKFIKTFNILNTKVYNTYFEQSDEHNNIYVLTQEKAINIFSNNIKFEKDTVLIVDEIQNIEKITDNTDERSKILYDVLNEFRYKNNIKQIVISGPRINNVAETAETIFGDKAKKIITNDSPVLNLTYSIYKDNIVKKKKEQKYFFKQYCSLTTNPIKIEITNSSIINGYGQKKYNEKFIEYLNKITNSLSDTQKIIFSPTTNTARKIACCLNNISQPNDKIKELIEYYKKTVHNNYPLCNTLNTGIAYHHAKLPHHVKRTLEKALQENWINTIVCTTTLLQGINLPTQNIIIRNPNLYIQKKEKVVELTNYEMANLRGRAGRLLKDFIGRTFVLDESSFIITEGYNENNPFNDVTKDLPMSYKEKFDKYKDEIISDLLIKQQNEEKKEVHYKDLLTYIRHSVLKYGDNAIKRMNNVGINLTREQIAAIKLKLDRLSIPKEICYKNRYWDPFTLNFIYENFKDKVPTHPFERGTKNRLEKILKFLRDNPKTKVMYNKYIPEKYRKGPLRSYLIKLSLDWAKGEFLSKIIKSNLINNNESEEAIEEIIDLLQKTISYSIPLLIKPIIDIKNSNSCFLSCLQSGASMEVTKTLIEMGVPRECALYLYDNLFKETKKEKLESNLIEILRNNYDTLPYWIQVQLNFLI